MCTTRSIHDSPVITALNSLLRSHDISKSALLVRAVDWYDDADAVQQKHTLQHEAQDTPLLPSSILHVSTRAPNAMFPGGRRASAGVLIGTHVNLLNTIHKTTDKSVHTTVYYPMDAGTYKRNALITNDGKACNRHQGLSGICLGETCLTTFQDTCACLNKQVPPDKVGDFFSSWVKWIGGKQRGLNRYICWYENLQDMREASNSLWLHRESWSVYSKDAERDYMGWNECPVTANVRHLKLLDAIVIQLPLQPHDTSNSTSLCDYGTQVHTDILASLQSMHQMGYTRRLPVVFLTYIRGMNQDNCHTYWNGHDCTNGYLKTLVAHEFTFSDGSCLAIPEQCTNVYYFEYNNMTETCGITSNFCLEMEKPNEQHAIVTDNANVSNTTVDTFTTSSNVKRSRSLNRFLALQSADSIPSTMAYPTMLSVFTMMAISTIVAMLFVVRLRNRPRRRTRA